MGYLKARLKGGHVYEECIFWKELSDRFKDILWFREVYRCAIKKYILGGTRISENAVYKRKRNCIEFKDGIRYIIPEDKDMYLFKQEVLDIILPLYCSTKYEFGA